MAGIEVAFAAFGTLKSAYELVRDLRKSNDPTILKAGIEELTDRLLAAREDALKVVEQLDMLRVENGQLKSEMANVAKFDERAQDFELKENDWGSFVYFDKKNTLLMPPAYCAHCFDNRRLSILQATNVHAMKRCPACQNTQRG